MKVFWSWQSDTQGRTGRHLVRDALKAAIEDLKQVPDVVEPIERETRSELHVDHDRQGISGSPDLARVILEKIEQAAVFIGDVTLTGVAKAGEGAEPKKKAINSNVAIELGYALRALGDRSLLMVMNEYYGTRAELPFDLQTKAGHIIYTLAPDADSKRIADVARQLKAQFIEALKLFVERRVESVRREAPFPEAKTMEEPGRFRAPGKPIGSIWDLSLAGHVSGAEISLAKGPATWLRLMPISDPRKTWTAQELRDAGRLGAILQPFIFSSLFIVRAEDGVGACNLLTAQSVETNSVVFAFETGEVWAVDTWALGVDHSKVPVPQLERYWTQHLQGYAEFLGRLGLHGPYGWIAGISGARHRRLAYPPAPGRSWYPDWSGPECLAEEIVTEGSYYEEQSPFGALLPFLELIFQKCGIRRPDYLPR
jgi:hypothetical protein